MLLNDLNLQSFQVLQSLMSPVMVGGVNVAAAVAIPVVLVLLLLLVIGVVVGVVAVYTFPKWVAKNDRKLLEESQ